MDQENFKMAKLEDIGNVGISVTHKKSIYLRGFTGSFITLSHLEGLEDETQDLKKKLNQIRSQLEGQDQHREAVWYAEKMQEYLQKL